MMTADEALPSAGDERDDIVARVLEALRRLVRGSHKTQRAIEQENGFARGYLSQVLHGHMALTARHIFGILLALKVQPGTFFAELFPMPGAGTEGALSEIRERMARYDSALRQLEERGLLRLEDWQEGRIAQEQEPASSPPDEPRGGRG